MAERRFPAIQLFRKICCAPILSVVLCISSSACHAKDKEVNVEFRTSVGKLIKRFHCEVADTRSKRQLGLMYRKHLEQDSCMLFVFSEEELRSFWMKNTFIPLDIIFVNSQFKVVSVSEHTKPLSEKPIISGKPALYVIELNAGLVESHHITPGNLVYIGNPQ